MFSHGSKNLDTYSVDSCINLTGDLAPVPSPRKSVSSRLSEGNHSALLADWPVLLMYMLALYTLHQSNESLHFQI